MPYATSSYATSASYDPSAAPVSGECQTTYFINHFAEKVETRSPVGTLLKTEYAIYKDITRTVQCIDPLKRDAIQQLHVEPEKLISTTSGLDASGQAIVRSRFVSRMNMLTELRCVACVGAEVSGGAYKNYQLIYDTVDTSAQTLAETEYGKQERFHKYYRWTPSLEPMYYDPPKLLMEDILRSYNVQWGSEINTTLSTTSFFSPCATETTDTGCTS